MPISNGEKPVHETVMDVVVEQIARVYAKAYMGVIKKLPNTEGLVSELNSLITDVLDRFPKLQQTLDSSLVSQEEKEQLLDDIFSRAASPQLLTFLKVLARHNRLNLVRSISEQVAKLELERRGIVDVEVRVARELDEDIRRDIESRLQQRFGKKPVLRVRIDPSIIAGIVVRAGDQVADGSLNTQLEHTRKLMVDRAIEQIETKPERFMATV